MDMLTTFPPEVWDHITTHMDCYTVVALAYTSKRAIPLLGRGGLTCLSIAGLSREAAEKLPSPSFLKQMTSLRHLSWTNMSQVILGLKVYQSLPPKLVSLELEVSVPLSYEFHTLLPQSLTHLRMPFTFDAQTDQLPPLPSSITSLVVPNGPQFTNEAALFSSQLPQLLYLDFGGTLPRPSDYRNLPPNLVSLRTSGLYLKSHEWLALLPSTITHLDLNQRLSVAELALLPLKLESLTTNLDDASLDWVNCLPKSLTRLWHSSADGPCKSQVLFTLLHRPVEEHAPALALLSKMQNWQHSYNHWTVPEIEAIAPRIAILSLPSLSLPRQLEGEPRLAPEPWLTCLTTLIVTSELKGRLIQTLPDSITHLEVPNDLDSSWRLPASLTLLKCPIAPTIKTHPGRMNYPAPCVRWPRNFRSFESTCIVADVAEPAFPSSITAFAAPTCSAYGSDFSLKLLSSLKSVECPHFRHLSQEMVEQFPDDMHTLLAEFSPKLTSKVLKSLPPNLTKLSLAWDDDSLFTDDNLHLLPRTLTFLALGISKYITHEGAAKLPPALRTLEWNYAKQLNASIARALPRNLTELHMIRVEVDSMAFGELPRTLKTLKLAGAIEVDSAYFSDLPPALTSLDLSSVTKLPDYGLQQLVDLPQLKTLQLAHSYKTNLKQHIVLSRLPNPPISCAHIMRLTGDRAITTFDH